MRIAPFLLALGACNGGGATEADAQRFVGTWTLTSGTATVTCSSEPPRVDALAADDVLLAIARTTGPGLALTSSNADGSEPCAMTAKAEGPDLAILMGTECPVTGTTLKILGGSLSLVAAHLELLLELTATANGTTCSTVFDHDFVTK